MIDMMDIYKIKALAIEAKSRGPWRYENPDCTGGQVVRTSAWSDEPEIIANDMRSWEDGKYIAEVDPDTILGLIDEIERLRVIPR